MTGRVDLHAHLPVHVGGGAGAAVAWDLGIRLAAMDALDIEYQVLSIPHLPDGEDAAVAARRANERLAAIVDSAPDRLGAFATAPAIDAASMAAEFEYGVTELGLHGIGLVSNARGQYLGDGLFADTLDYAAAAHVPALLHPALNPMSAPLLQNREAFLVEYPLDTARSLISALLHGTLTSRPDLRLIAAHCGGVLPSLAWRLEHLAVLGAAKDEHSRQPEQIQQGLRQLYWDTALSGDLGVLAPIAALVCDTHVVYGSDYGAATTEIVQHNHQPRHAWAAERLTDEQLRGNALTLLRRG